MADEPNDERRIYRRIYTPDIFRTVHMLSPYDMLRNLKAELDNMERGMGHHIWDEKRRRRPLALNITFGTPHYDIFDEGDNLKIVVEIPGGSKEDIDLDMAEDHFEIKARTRYHKCVENAFSVRCEEREGEFGRKVDLPIPVDPNGARASFKNDVLEIEVPKKQVDKKRTKIAIE